MGRGFSSALEVLDDVGVEETRGILPVPGKIPEGKNDRDTFFFFSFMLILNILTLKGRRDSTHPLCR